jgi:pimeloyl-ACP methyl ester carboxylesterase
VTEPYGPHPDQVIDFWFPDEPGDLPFVTLLHGGFWRERFDRRHLSPLAAHLAGRGFAVALAEYRRVTAVLPREKDETWQGEELWPREDASGDGLGEAPGGPGMFEDVGRVVAVARRLADRHRPGAADRRQVVVGHSAGGHLALWAAAAHGDAVDAVVALAPVADLAHGLALDVGDGAVADLLRGDPALLAELDPAALLPTGVPTTLIHGRDDASVPFTLSERFVAAARAAGDGARLVALDRTGHFTLIEPGSPACRVLEEELLRYP